MNVVDGAETLAVRPDPALNEPFGVGATAAFGRQKLTPRHLERLAVVYKR